MILVERKLLSKCLEDSLLQSNAGGLQRSRNRCRELNRGLFMYN